MGLKLFKYPLAQIQSILYCYVSVYKETSTNDFHLNKSIRSFGFQYQLYLFEVNKCVWILVGKCSIGKPLFFNLLSLCLYEWTHVGRLHWLTSNFLYLFNYIIATSRTLTWLGAIDLYFILSFEGFHFYLTSSLPFSLLSASLFSLLQFPMPSTFYVTHDFFHLHIFKLPI